MGQKKIFGLFFVQIKYFSSKNNIFLRALLIILTGDDLDASLLRREGPDVPDPERVVHRVGQDVRAVGGEGQAEQRHRN